MAENTIKKKGLGRGLSHLFGEAEAAYRVSEPEAPAAPQAPAAGNPTLPVAFLRPGKFQPRRHFDDDALNNLAESRLLRGNRVSARFDEIKQIPTAGV